MDNPMKYAILIVDGMADDPLEELDGRTPLEAARTPNLDALIENGRVGRVQTLPEGFPATTDVAALVILGYNPARAYTGRGAFEALGMGIPIKPGTTAFRFSLVTVAQDILVDPTAGHISTREAAVLVNLASDHMQEAASPLRLHQGEGHRGVMLCDMEEAEKILCTPPPELLGENISDHWPKGPGADVLIDAMRQTQRLFQDHDINKVRTDLGESPADMTWLWGPGTTPGLQPFLDRFALVGAVVTSADYMRGIGRAVGWRDIGWEPASQSEGPSDLDARHSAMASAAAEALSHYDIILLHVQAPDAAGLDGDVPKKVESIESIDARIVPLLVNAGRDAGDWRMLVLPSLHTSAQRRRHTRQSVPFLMTGAGVDALRHVAFTETAAQQSDMFVTAGHELMQYFLQH